MLTYIVDWARCKVQPMIHIVTGQHVMSFINYASEDFISFSLKLQPHSGLSFLPCLLPPLSAVRLQRQFQVHTGQGQLRGHLGHQEELPVLQVSSPSTFFLSQSLISPMSGTRAA